MLFSHEKLTVYQRAIEFIGWVQPIIESVPAKVSARDQLERASTSIALNIAEGNGKFSPNDRARYFESANGSAVECAACLDVLVARKLLAEEQALEGKRPLNEISKMLVALVRKFGDRFQEEPPDYLVGDSVIHPGNRDSE